MTKRVLLLIGIAVFFAIPVKGETIAFKALPFPLTDVRLLDSPFKAAQEVDGKYMLSLDADRLLHDFRVNAGLPSSAQPLGGWEAPNCELRGHFVGHYLSACALMYASTGDERFKQRADEIVEELAKCQQALGQGGYLSAYPESFFDRLESGQKVWAPYYTIHKIMAGLMDVNQLCGNAQALEIDNGMARYFKHRIDALSDDQMQMVMRTEFGGMMEVLANLSAVTGDADQLALAKRFDHHAVFDPLAAKEDKLARLHANTQIPKMTGSARVYELSGDMRYHDVPEFFWEAVTEHHSFVTGSNSFGEMFRAPDVEASDLVMNTAETCNTYNMLKLTRHLFEWEPQAQYMDYYEKALYNHILGSIDPETGMTLYYLSLHPGHFKVYSTPTQSFWCCTGTGVENHAKYGDTIYFHKENALWVNLFIPSELQWKENGVTIRQETKFPEEGKTTLTMKMGTPAKLAINLRIPSWTSDATVKINGDSQTMKLEPGSYA
ncbi:MAG TPA: glycoside hydrolase family 127 protein, partial [Tepidisphaeraceae bacterium]|nr:glycoside hydrolase family 127 protein [Tepidisphaeraceae bacterium]